MQAVFDSFVNTWLYSLDISCYTQKGRFCLNWSKYLILRTIFIYVSILYIFEMIFRKILPVTILWITCNQGLNTHVRSAWKIINCSNWIFVWYNNGRHEIICPLDQIIKSKSLKYKIKDTKSGQNLILLLRICKKNIESYVLLLWDVRIIDERYCRSLKVALYF